jgi:hypothetical protein
VRVYMLTWCADANFMNCKVTFHALCVLFIS